MANLTLLEQKNPHERDANITFEPVAHKYTICGGKHSFISVTTWLHSHFEPFDADAIVTRMMTSPKWTSSPYYGQTREEIKAGWDKNRDEAAQAGTDLHYEIEYYYNRGDTPQPPIAEPTPAISSAIVEDKIVGGDAPKPPTASGIAASAIAYFMNYVHTHAATFVPYRTEWMVYDEEVRIAGSIDMVYEDPVGDGSLMIYDWKRAKEIKKTDGFNKFSTTECINHLPDTNFWHYALQLNIYKAIIERNYGKKVTTLMLVGLHPNNKNGDYLLFKVPHLHQEVSDLFELRKKQISL
jgi:hypothetical protein